MGQDLKLKEIEKLIKEHIPTLEEKMGVKINDHLRFCGQLQGQGNVYLKYIDEAVEFGLDEGDKYIGEWSRQTAERHGRGMKLKPNGNIEIGYWHEGLFALGNFVEVLSDGGIRVGECYLGEDGCERCKGVIYNIDGTTDTFDE